jgi:hypothetical protein
MKLRFLDLFIWKMDEQTLQEQVDGYDTLGLRDSYRKASAGWILLSVAISVALGTWLLKGFSQADILTSALIYLPLSFFVFKGHRWALIAAMVFWTIDKGFMCRQGLEKTASGQASSTAFVVHIFWWLLYMSFFTRAYGVERARRQPSDANDEASP